MKFSASYDDNTKVITILAAVLILLVLASMWVSLKAAGSMLSVLLILLAAFIALIMPYGFSVKQYELNNETLSICRPFGKKQFAFTTLTSASIIDPRLLRWSWRVFGSGGMFGYYGRFSNKQFGAMTWYLTRRDKVVYLQLVTGKKIMISPDDAESFIREYNLLKGIQ